jgi:hypothetical protein
MELNYNKLNNNKFVIINFITNLTYKLTTQLTIKNYETTNLNLR